MLTSLMKLHDPQLVADFQRLCGVVITDGGEKTPPTTSHNRHVANGGDHLHEHRNGSAKTLHENGFVDIASKLGQNGTTNGHVYRNGIIANGYDTEHLKQRLANGLGGAEQCNDLNESPSHATGDRQLPSDHSHQSSTKGHPKEITYKITYPLLHALFHFGAILGNEIFYITFYPFLLWNVDGFVARRLCIFWAAFMHIGQATKDVICWPRPASPPVVRLEKRYALEYGMPSTHAMVGAGMPFTLFYVTYFRYEYPFCLGLIISLAWCSLVCFSRIYLGMHTFLDLLAGLVYVFAMMPIYFYILEPLDHFVLHHPYAPFPIILVPLLAGIFYPKLEKWSTARGDTTLITGTASGVCLAYWYCSQHGIVVHPEVQQIYTLPTFTLSMLGMSLLRMLVGGIFVFATRVLIKTTTLTSVCCFLGVSKDDEVTKQRLAVELPTKFISYVVIALVTIILAPAFFRHLGIDRNSYFTEL